MKAKINIDKRNEVDKMWDDMYNKMVRTANLTPKQSMVVSKYLREIIGLRIHEIEAAVEMSYMLALVEREKFGTDVKHGAKRLVRVQEHAVEVRNEAYGHKCVDANKCFVYDGCGIEHLQTRLKRHGIEYETKLDK